MPARKGLPAQADDRDVPSQIPKKRGREEEDDDDYDGVDKPVIAKRPPLLPRTGIPASSFFAADRNAITRKFKVPTFLSGRPAGGALRAGTTLGTRPRTNVYKGPLYDPEAPDAIVLHHPRVLSATEKLEALKLKPKDGSSDVEVHVVVDPMLGKVLRPHQIEGVRFLYNCVTGRVKDNAYGCIMADEMGLGKTLQCITLLWTLLKQSPQAGKATIDKAVIACPSSLVKNWANELVKWLGPNSIRPYACDNKGTKEQTEKDMRKFVSDKGRGIVQPVLIVSYETLRIYCDILCQTEIGLLLCDEGHRLKNADSQTYINLNKLNAKRRVILSGTPIQNDLTEYFALISFAIPDVLGSGAEFRKKYELPILRGRDAEASEKDRNLSEERLKELLAIANQFIIRRTAELLTKYLPVKYEHVVFCKLTDAQMNLYKHFTKSKEVSRLLSGSGSQPLRAITFLKKLCNHPALIDRKLLGPETDSILPPNFDWNKAQAEFSGKMLLLERMLDKMRKTSSDKIVLISNYTQTLDLIEIMCRQRRWGQLRLDGSMTIQKRQKLVDRFNDPAGPEFIFLLSSKAGGCGINLIGANRLILFDPDWNPANDAQALARVWRDGQKKTCFIYRFIATGSIEEKIFQRQAHKQSLSSCVVDAEEDVERHFSLENLRQLFLLNEDTLSDTHDTFRCKRCVRGMQMKKPAENTVNTGAQAADTSNWNHFSKEELHKVHDTVLKDEGIASGVATYVFQNKSHDQQVVKLK
ncbi:P-loop containing nucleoside triphosphate hydrolase protein [Fimicolochytrium jonesii]|uniref:P-loop containing nucleoside triphosphate hydrolase protein n=1 Tax=Fimicolochytrium jonesii TaxID=1396493 RepID=UPI0022FDD3BF|nr:P-loop containing nucleoside triphosphate hydrolase protein [Fimicolochytrium jonesii]KAI8819837.1 P-loop containing nucleoside triphosphate hydrolase protein [Fimicolochytrium jonesii]